MKRKILSLVFAAAMLLGTATMTKAMNSWECITVTEDCGPHGGFTAMICGDDFFEQQEMLSVWFEIYDC